MTRLEAKNLSLALSGRTILSNLEMDLREGEILGLIGPNGAGKTTLLRALVGLLPHQGQVFLDGNPLSALSPAERARRVAFLPQASALHWAMPVRSMVALGRLPHRPLGKAETETDRAAVARAMTEADVLDLAGKAVTTLSGGERARVMLARALAVEAPVTLADEPIAFLDPRHQLAVLENLTRRATAGQAFLLVLHDLSLAARFCHRILVMKDGRLIAQGPPAQVLDASLLKTVFGIRAIHGDHQGVPFLLPWEVASP